MRFFKTVSNGNGSKPPLIPVMVDEQKAHNEALTERIREQDAEIARLKEIGGRWMSLATVQQRVIETLRAEVQRTSAYVENHAIALSERFKTLADTAVAQTTRADSLTTLANTVEID